MTGPAGSGVEAYRRSGVDLEAAERAVELIRRAAAPVSRPESVGGLGGFAGLFRLGDGRLLAAAADGVGTKVEVARRLGRLDTIGIDLVAMSANDVICTGAEPLFFLDYLAVGKLVPGEAAEIVRGVAEGCRRAGCALLGGETAEHSGTMPAGAFDLAGFCVGIVDEERLLGPHRVAEGDLLLGFPSSGLHANGFSLVRQALLRDGARLDADHPLLGRPLADELLEPTAIYVRPLLGMVREGLARSAAHITGGGFRANLPRALPEGLGAAIDRSAWTAPPIFSIVADAAGIPADGLFDVLNMGIGMVVVVGEPEADRAVARCREEGLEGLVVGEVVAGAGVHLG